MNKTLQILLWPALAILGAFSFAAIALNRGETVSAVWLVTAALCVFFIAYRFYSKFIAEKVLQLDDVAHDARGAAQRRHGLRADQQVRALRPPLRGHRRRRAAGRAGARRADGLPARHALDSGRRRVRRRGAGFHRPVRARSAATAARSARWSRWRSGPVAGSHRAGRRAGDHDHHPRGARASSSSRRSPRARGALFTIAATIPIALLMGIYMRFIRPGKMREASRSASSLLLRRIWSRPVRVAADPTWAPLFTLDGHAARVGADRVRRDRRRACRCG